MIFYCEKQKYTKTTVLLQNPTVTTTIYYKMSQILQKSMLLENASVDNMSMTCPIPILNECFLQATIKRKQNIIK